MTDFSGLQQLTSLIRNIEAQMEGAKLMILTHEHREEIARHMVEGLVGPSREHKVRIETSSGEYMNQLAILEIGGNKYTFSKDHQGMFISEINYYTCRITPNSHGILVYHQDYPGVIHDVSRVLAENKINISSMNVSREQKGKSALLVSLTDEEIPQSLLSRLQQLPQVQQVLSLQ
ncbi:ACT domain-containing protein [Ammoniphilus sp. CFH 90114]|nr:ACT domain-containing protein [Ammoniphilus sp. CFH 90114]